MKIIHDKQQQEIRSFSQLQTQTRNTPRENKSCLRIIKATDIYFTQEGIKVLSKRLKYDLLYKGKILLETLALEAETALSKLDITEQHYRYMAAKKIKIYQYDDMNNMKSGTE
jgi:hypothetical protein